MKKEISVTKKKTHRGTVEGDPSHLAFLRWRCYLCGKTGIREKDMISEECSHGE